MAVLTGNEIRHQRERGNIIIEPWVDAHVGENSYDLRLGDKLLVYDRSIDKAEMGEDLVKEGPKSKLCRILDMQRDNPTTELTIPPEGLVLHPGILYLGHTLEYTETEKFVPIVEGRSSAGRLGMKVHFTAGFGDRLFKGDWTLEIEVIHPLRVYAGVRVAQIIYHTLEGSSVPVTQENTKDNEGRNQVGSGRTFVRKSNRAIDLTRRKFGRLRVLYDSGERRNKKIIWVCRCKCGAIHKVPSANLINGTISSCGCLRNDTAKKRAESGARSGAVRKTHGMSRLPVYAVYRTMLRRCADLDNNGYGGRGIRVCRRWRGAGGFERFLADMGMPPSRDHSIERKNTNGPYTPTNCRWATRSEQARNRRRNRYVVWNGNRVLLIELAEKKGIPYKVLHQRYVQRNWTLADAVNRPLRGAK
jgi:dCTP deaminase